MRLFPLLVLLSACLPPAPAADERTPSHKEKLEDRRAAREEKRAAAKKVDFRFNFKKEFAALEQAAGLLDSVTDEKSAAQVAGKLTRIFSVLPVPTKGTEEQLEQWAELQNAVNLRMEALRRNRYFEPSGLQKAWTLITDPVSRRTYKVKL